MREFHLSGKKVSGTFSAFRPAVGQPDDTTVRSLAHVAGTSGIVKWLFSVCL